MRVHRSQGGCCARALRELLGTRRARSLMSSGRQSPIRAAKSTGVVLEKRLRTGLAVLPAAVLPSPRNTTGTAPQIPQHEKAFAFRKRHPRQFPDQLSALSKTTTSECKYQKTEHSICLGLGLGLYVCLSPSLQIVT